MMARSAAHAAEFYLLKEWTSSLTLRYEDNCIIVKKSLSHKRLVSLSSLGKNIVVITPSLAVASVLQFSKSIETILLGGVIRQGSPHVTGIVTETVLEMFSVDIAFQGADGIGLDGAIYNADMGIAKVDHKIRRQAYKTYILADSSKIGKAALIKSGYIYEVDALITDDKINRQHLASFKKSGANVIVSS